MGALRWSMGLAVLVAVEMAGGGPQGAPRAAAAQPVDVIEVPVAAEDLVYEPHSGMFFAAERGDGGGTPGRTVIPIDPATGVAGTPIPVGDNPNDLAVSDDGRYLYVGVDEYVVQVDVVTRAVTARWNINVDGITTNALFIDVLPGTNDTVIVSHQATEFSPGLLGIGIYDAGVRRPELTAQHTGPIWFAPTGPDHLVGYANNYNSSATLYQIAVGADGLHVTGQSSVPLPAGTTLNARYAGGRVYAGSRVVDVASGSVVATLPGYVESVAPDLAHQRVIAGYLYQPSGNGVGVRLDFFDPSGHQMIDSFDIGTTPQYPGSIIRDMVVSDDGVVAVAVSGSVKVFDARPVRGAAGEYTPLTPSRVLDTRTGTGMGGAIGPVGPGGTRDVQITGVGGVPATGVDSVVLNATVAAPTEPSYLTVWPSGGPQPDNRLIPT